MANNLVPSGDFILAQLGINPNNLRADFPIREKRLQYRAVVNWLTDYQAKSDATNLDKIKGLLEAFHHLCEVEDWKRAAEILLTRLNTPSNQLLHEQLDTWGYYREQTDLYKRILGKLNSSLNSIFLNGIGMSYHAQNNYEKATEYLWQAFQDRLKNLDFKGVGTTLGHLGLIYYSLGNYVKAIEYHKQHLSLAKVLRDLESERMALGNLGNAYTMLGDFSQALDFQEQHRILAKQLQDKRSEANALGSIGTIYNALGDSSTAIVYHKKNLIIAKEIQDRIGELAALNNLALAHDSLGYIAEAIDYGEQALAIAKEIDRRSEGKILMILGKAYFKIDEHKKGIEHLLESLNIGREFQDFRHEGLALRYLGNAYYYKRDYAKAIESYKQSLIIAQKLKDLEGQEKNLTYLVRSYWECGDYNKAIECNQQHLAIVNLNQAKLYCKLGDRTLALEYCDRALSIATELGIPLAKECQELKEKLLNQEVT